MDDRAAVTAAEVARLAGVGRAAVSNWRRRYDDFPQPVGGSDTSPTFRLDEVRAWLRAQGKLGAHSLRELAWQELEAGVAPGASMADRVARAGAYLAGRDTAGRLEAPVREALDGLAAEVGRDTAFEQLCARYVEAFSRQLAVTPSELATLMLELAQGSAGPVLDPACGTGSLLRALPASVAVRGQELDAGLAALSRARLAFTHGNARIETGDALRADAFPGLEAAAVVCNPPFNERHWGFDELQYDPRWVYGLPPKSESELAWVQHCLAHLRPGGRAVIVMPPGVASRRSGRPIRAALLRRGALRAVLSLPPGAVPPSHLSMQLWVLEQPGARPAADEVLLVDTSGGSQMRLDELGWATVAERARRAMRGEGDPAVYRAVPVIELLDDDVDLSPVRHLRPAPGFADVEPLQIRMNELLGALADLLPNAAPADSPGARPMTTIGELARQGAVVVRQQVGRLETSGEGAGRPVLTGRDVVTGQPPSSRLVGDEPLDSTRLEVGDVVVPTIAPRPVALVVEEETDTLLGAHLQLLRPDPAQIDPWFLAGFLRSGESVRVAATLSGSYRVDVRRVELPRLPLAEQRRLGAAFRRLVTFRETVDAAAELGGRLERALLDGIASGHLEPDGTIRRP